MTSLTVPGAGVGLGAGGCWVAGAAAGIGVGVTTGIVLGAAVGVGAGVAAGCVPPLWASSFFGSAPRITAAVRASTESNADSERAEPVDGGLENFDRHSSCGCVAYVEHVFTSSPARRKWLTLSNPLMARTWK